MCSQTRLLQKPLLMYVNEESVLGDSSWLKEEKRSNLMKEAHRWTLITERERERGESG